MIPLKHAKDPDSDFDPKALATGVAIEKEHSDSLPVRKAISKGHLAEFDDYYDELPKMEKKLEKKEARWATEYFQMKVALPVDFRQQPTISPMQQRQLEEQVLSSADVTGAAERRYLLAQRRRHGLGTAALLGGLSGAALGIGGMEMLG